MQLENEPAMAGRLQVEGDWCKYNDGEGCRFFFNYVTEGMQSHKAQNEHRQEGQAATEIYIQCVGTPGEAALQ